MIVAFLRMSCCKNAHVLLHLELSCDMSTFAYVLLHKCVCPVDVFSKIVMCPVAKLHMSCCKPTMSCVVWVIDVRLFRDWSSSGLCEEDTFGSCSRHRGVSTIVYVLLRPCMCPIAKIYMYVLQDLHVLLQNCVCPVANLNMSCWNTNNVCPVA